MLSENSIVEFHARLKVYALRRGRYNDAGDIASFGVIQVLEGAIPNVHFRYVDYFRDRYTRIYPGVSVSEVNFQHVTMDALKESVAPDSTDSIYKILYYEKLLTPLEIQLLKMRSEGHSFPDMDKKLRANSCMLLRKIEEKLNLRPSKPIRKYENKPMGPYEKTDPASWETWYEMKRRLKN
jgi:hypothetical protein